MPIPDLGNWLPTEKCSDGDSWRVVQRNSPGYDRRRRAYQKHSGNFAVNGAVSAVNGAVSTDGISIAGMSIALAARQNVSSTAVSKEAAP
jgi:hypothetical protein